MFDHLPRTNFGGPFDSTSVTPARNSHIVTQAMRLFLVWDSEGISEKTDTIMEDLFSACDCDTDSEGGRKTKSKGSIRKGRRQRAAVLMRMKSQVSLGVPRRRNPKRPEQ